MAVPDTVRLTTKPMRTLLMVASILVINIGTLLFILPTKTDTFFSWTVNPPLTAAFLGAAYLAAFLFEVVAYRERLWARASLAVPGVLSFIALMLIVTLIHLDKFHLGDDVGALTLAITWTWLIAYAILPVLMPVLWVLQYRAPGSDPVRRNPAPTWMRVALVSQASVMLLLGLGLLFAPTSVAPSTWPWALSALTGRAVAAWLIGLGISAIQTARNNELTNFEGSMIAYLAMGVLQLVALVRFATADHPITGQPVLDWSDARTWIYVAFLVSIAVVGALGAVASRRAKKAEQPGAA